jgi:hypothetical protein
MNPCSFCALPTCGDIGVESKTNEWNLLKRQFDELARDDSAGSDSIEIELDADFHRRFAELINRVCGPSKYYQKADPFPHGS